MRNRFADTFYELGRADPELYIVVADISPAGSIQKFREEFPRRFINTGVAEQSMIGIAAGLALRGCRAFAYTIATFALYRPFEMVRDDLCYQGLPVTVVGIGGGVTYSTLGATHHAMEDVAIASAIPNLAVIAPSDPAEAEAATRYCARQTRGPVYLRLGKAGEPVLSEGADRPFEFGRLRYLRRGGDTCILSYGPIMRTAMEVAERLAAAGDSVSVVSAHTLKPLDRAGIAEALGSHRRIVVIEEHVAQGGLGIQVRAIAQQAGARCPIACFALDDDFNHVYGSHDELLAAHGLSADAVMAALG